VPLSAPNFARNRKFVEKDLEENAACSFETSSTPYGDEILPRRVAEVNPEDRPGSWKRDLRQDTPLPLSISRGGADELSVFVVRDLGETTARGF
jgi:hypothetical protein